MERMGSMTLQCSDRVVDLHQVGVLALAGKMEGDGSLQFGTIKEEAKGFS